MLTVTDEQLLSIVRDQVAAAVERERPLIAQEIAESFKWVTEERGAELLEIDGKQPGRTFRRLMNLHGVEKLKLGVLVRYRWKARPDYDAKRHGLSIEQLIEKHCVVSSKRRTSNVQRSTSNAQLQIVKERAA
jgi:hypothetical protein